MHLHVLDEFWFGKTRVGKFPKTGARRAAFWRESVADLRDSLRLRGQDLFVRFGMSSAEALRQLAQLVDIQKVFTYAEVCSEEIAIEAAVESVLKGFADGGCQLVRCWGYTLHHIEDLTEPEVISIDD